MHGMDDNELKEGMVIVIGGDTGGMGLPEIGEYGEMEEADTDETAMSGGDTAERLCSVADIIGPIGPGVLTDKAKSKLSADTKAVSKLVEKGVLSGAAADEIMHR